MQTAWSWFGHSTGVIPSMHGVTVAPRFSAGQGAPLLAASSATYALTSSSNCVVRGPASMLLHASVKPETPTPRQMAAQPSGQRSVLSPLAPSAVLGQT